MKSKPKYKVCRRLGPGIFDGCQTESFERSVARKSNAPRGRRPSRSNYGAQLLEKQKVRFSYGLTERQFRKYITAAEKAQKPDEALYAGLETRLDNVMYRLGWAPTRRAARQMVAHGHIIIGDKKMRIPSYHVQAGDVITIREGSKNKGCFLPQTTDQEERKVPTWLKQEAKKKEAQLAGQPTFDPVVVPFDLTVVLEFYSR